MAAGPQHLDQAVEVAEQAKAKCLVITHHDPDRDDTFLSDVEKKCQSRFPNSVPAGEGMDVLV